MCCPNSDIFCCEINPHHDLFTCGTIEVDTASDYFSAAQCIWTWMFCFRVISSVGIRGRKNGWENLTVPRTSLKRLESKLLVCCGTLCISTPYSHHVFHSIFRSVMPGVTSLKYRDGLHLAVGTSTGQVWLRFEHIAFHTMIIIVLQFFSWTFRSSCTTFDQTNHCWWRITTTSCPSRASLSTRARISFCRWTRTFSKSGTMTL